MVLAVVILVMLLAIAFVAGYFTRVYVSRKRRAEARRWRDYTEPDWLHANAPANTAANTRILLPPVCLQAGCRDEWVFASASLSSPSQSEESSLRVLPNHRAQLRRHQVGGPIRWKQTDLDAALVALVMKSGHQGRSGTARRDGLLNHHDFRTPRPDHLQGA